MTAQRVPYDADEKTSLTAALDRHRDAILWKLQGLDDEQLRRRMVPSDTTLLGMLKHLASVEYGWFCRTFGLPTEEVPFVEEDPDADWRVEPEETTQDILDYYAGARAAADASLAAHDLADTGTSWTGATVTMRWVLLHMVEEVCRHAGHADILRELIDGMAGDHDWPQE
jgi:uncharacterized damage-inducible protein DinB